MRDQVAEYEYNKNNKHLAKVRNTVRFEYGFYIDVQTDMVHKSTELVA